MKNKLILSIFFDVPTAYTFVIINYHTEKQVYLNNQVCSFLRLSISQASNLCTAVEGDQNKEFRGNA